MVNLDLIRRLREETGCGVIEAKKALEDAPTYGLAVTLLRQSGLERALSKKDRSVSQGLVFSYIHPNRPLGSLISLACETDFVARTEDFKRLGIEIAMQVTAMNPSSVEELLGQEYIREPSKKVKDLIVELSGKVGENIVIKDFKRLEI